MSESGSIEDAAPRISAGRRGVADGVSSIARQSLNNDKDDRACGRHGEHGSARA